MVILKVAEPSFVSLLRDKYRLIPEHMTAITTHDTVCILE